MIRATGHLEMTSRTLKHSMFSSAFGSCRANATFIKKKKKKGRFLREDCVAGMFLTGLRATCLIPTVLIEFPQ